MEGEFEANQQDANSPTGFKVAAAFIKVDTFGVLGQKEDVFKSFSTNGMDGGYTINFYRSGLPTRGLYFAFYGFDLPGTLTIVETSIYPSVVTPIAIGFCHQAPLKIAPARP